MTEFRVRGRSDLDAGEAGNGKSDGPMDVAMEMAMAVTSIAAETDTAGATMFEPTERNQNGKCTRRREALAAPSDWWSRMERTIRQQAQELTQLHRTVGHPANLVEARAACEEAQRLAMMTWMQEREQKWDDRHEDNKVWGAGITIMIAQTMNGVVQGQDWREREREMSARTDSGGMEASQHADTTHVEGPEECPQPQQQSNPKPEL